MHRARHRRRLLTTRTSSLGPRMVLLFATALAACTEAPPPEQVASRPAIARPQSAPSSLLGGIALTVVDRRVQPNPAGRNDRGKFEFESAFRTALSRGGLLAADATAAPFQLAATLLDVSREPRSAGSITWVSACVPYQLYRTGDGRQLLNGTVSSLYEDLAAEVRPGVTTRGAIWAAAIRLVSQLSTVVVPSESDAGKKPQAPPRRVLGAGVLLISAGCAELHAGP